MVGAARELQEETGLIVNTEDLHSVGRIEYEHRLEHGKVLSLQVHIFQTRCFTGCLVETEEMRPQWFRESEVPYTEMWPDDKEWYPLLFSDKKFNASILFEGYDQILSQNINVIDS